METIKKAVQEHYGKIAAEQPKSSCCCSPASAEAAYGRFADLAPADLNLGCGIPTDDAEFKEGMTVLDLGSGAGIDVFIAARAVGPRGSVIGLDLTQEMIERSRRNAEALKISNVEFRLGDIEAMPVADNSIDRVISNCVINLVPDKRKAFAEIRRVLRQDGQFFISDMVTTGVVPDDVRSDPELWAGCIAGALDKDDYLAVIRDSGFRDVQILKEASYPQKSGDRFTLLSITVCGTK